VLKTKGKKKTGQTLTREEGGKNQPPKPARRDKSLKKEASLPLLRSGGHQSLTKQREKMTGVRRRGGSRDSGWSTDDRKKDQAEGEGENCFRVGELEGWFGENQGCDTEDGKGKRGERTSGARIQESCTSKENVVGECLFMTEGGRRQKKGDAWGKPFPGRKERKGRWGVSQGVIRKEEAVDWKGMIQNWQDMVENFSGRRTLGVYN